LSSAAPEAGVRIREWCPGPDDAPLLALGNRAFDLERTPEFFAWKYRANPAGPARIGVAELDGRPVCMAAALPMRMRLGGRDVRGSISVDIATAPELRGRGLYRRVASTLWTQLAEDGFALTYGFTNRLSTDVTLGVLGRREVGPLPLRVRPLRPVRLAAAALGLGSDAVDPGPDVRPAAAGPAAGGPLGEGVERVAGFDARWDELWRRIEPNVDVAVVRDSRFLSWRYVERPDADYEILADLPEGPDGPLGGYLIWRPLDRFGVRSAFVADLAADPGHPGAAARLLRGAARRARHRGASLLALLSWPGCPTHPTARRLTPFPVPPALFPQMNVFSAIGHGDVDTAALADPARWWIGWGDSDVV
jgi:GNAT superfamily N-acetyltransferase